MKLIDTIIRAPLRIGFGRRGGGGGTGAGQLTLVRDADSMTLVPEAGLPVLLPPATTDRAGVLTAAERAAIAGLAAGGAGTGLVGARSGIAALVLDGGTRALLATGFAAPGDGGGALYARVASEPAHPLKARSGDRVLPDGTVSAANGGWWEIVADGGLDLRAAGAVGNGVADDTQAFRDAAAFLAARAAAGRAVPPLLLPAGRFRVTAAGALSDGFAGAGAPALAVLGAGAGASEILHAPPAPPVLNAGAPVAGAGSTVTEEAPGVWRVTRNGGGNPRAAWAVAGLVPGRRYTVAGRVRRGTVPDTQALRLRVADSATLTGVLRAETRIARGGERFRLTFEAAAATQHVGALAETGGAAGWFELEAVEVFDARTTLVETGTLGRVTLSGLTLTAGAERVGLVLHRGGPDGGAELVLRDLRLAGPASVAVETLGAPATFEDVAAELPSGGTVLLASPAAGRPPARLRLARSSVVLPGAATAVELRDGAALDWTGGRAALGDGATLLKARGPAAAATLDAVAPAAAGAPGAVRWLDAGALAARFRGMDFAGAGAGGAPAFLLDPDAEARPVLVLEDCRLSAAETLAVSDGTLLRFDRTAMGEWQAHVVSYLRREGGAFASPQIAVRGRPNGPDADPFATERTAPGTAVPTAPLIPSQPAPKLLVHRQAGSGADGGLAFATGGAWGAANAVPVPLGSVVTRLRVVWNGPAAVGDTAGRRVRAEAADGTVLIPETAFPGTGPAVLDSGPLWLRLPTEALRVLSVLGRVEGGAPGGTSLDHAHAVVEYL